MRKSFVDFSKKTHIMGILNITPDSFFDKGEFFDAQKALEHARDMIRQGADIIDVGAMSTRPGSEKISADEEIKRLQNIISEISSLENCLVSVDTVYPETAKFALRQGASIINDVSGVFNSDTARLVREYDAWWVVTHAPSENSGDTVLYKNGVTQAVVDFFADILRKCDEYSLKREKIILDPGFGFCKNTAENLEVLKNFSVFKKFSQPLLCALSAKRFIGDITGEEEPKNRLYGTLAANIAAVRSGADIIRVHDVRAHDDAIKMFNSLKAGE